MTRKNKHRYGASQGTTQAKDYFALQKRTQSFYWVECPVCGIHELQDVHLVEMHEDGGTATWRCPNCNDIQSSAVMFLD